MVSPETGQYAALPSEDSGSHIRREKNETFQEAVLYERRSNPWFLLCVLSWIVFGGIAVLFTWSYTSRASPTDSYEHGWKTDFVTARSAVDIELKHFTGAPAYDDKGVIFVPNPDKVDYVGQPSPELDLAWERLVGGRYFLISEEEAKSTWGADYKSYWSYSRGGYVAGLDMFHTLHCLNKIRMQLHPEYYQDKPGHGHTHEERSLVHDGHCIDQIRQYIMCAGDLTVIGTKYYPSIDRNYVLSDVAHTCRNFDQIRDWTWERYNGSSAVKPSHHSLKPPL